MAMSTNEVCKMITDRVIKELENGIIPWEKPWIAPKGLTGAFNRISKQPYSLLNQMMLGEPGEYASLKQWNNLGGRIKKGENGRIVVFWKPYHRDVETADEETGEIVQKTVPFFILKYYYVFHISQVEGVDPLKIEDESEDKNEPIKKAESIMNGYLSNDGIKISRGRSDRAYYSPALDKIVLPALKYFKTSEDFYDTAFHEMTHSTGHKSRLNRFTEKESTGFGSESYSKEELVAEIGSAALANFVGTATEKTERNNTAYIQNWLQPLKNDVRFIVSAAGKAEKAVNYILESAEKFETEATLPA